MNNSMTWPREAMVAVGMAILIFASGVGAGPNKTGMLTQRFQLGAESDSRIRAIYQQRDRESRNAGYRLNEEYKKLEALFYNEAAENKVNAQIDAILDLEMQQRDMDRRTLIELRPILGIENTVEFMFENRNRAVANPGMRNSTGTNRRESSNGRGSGMNREYERENDDANTEADFDPYEGEYRNQGRSRFSPRDEDGRRMRRMNPQEFDRSRFEGNPGFELQPGIPEDFEPRFNERGYSREMERRGYPYEVRSNPRGRARANINADLDDENYDENPEPDFRYRSRRFEARPDPRSNNGYGAYESRTNTGDRRAERSRYEGDAYRYDERNQEAARPRMERGYDPFMSFYAIDEY